ncbi:MAG TPA: hypothetical protein ENI67_01120 [Gammaproteobacteria bacterium]|nr:hypothetical protein [Gammaproteobacteria bacterium]
MRYIEKIVLRTEQRLNVGPFPSRSDIETWIPERASRLITFLLNSFDNRKPLPFYQKDAYSAIKRLAKDPEVRTHVTQKLDEEDASKVLMHACICAQYNLGRDDPPKNADRTLLFKEIAQKGRELRKLLSRYDSHDPEEYLGEFDDYTVGDASFWLYDGRHFLWKEDDVGLNLDEMLKRLSELADERATSPIRPLQLMKQPRLYWRDKVIVEMQESVETITGKKNRAMVAALASTIINDMDLTEKTVENVISKS